MAGCLRNVLAGIGCGTLLVAGGVVAWEYRGPIAARYQGWIDGDRPGSGPTVGRPSEDARRAGEAKEADLARRRGPAYVVLSADELASLVAHRLDPVVRRAMDSLTVRLETDRVTLEAQMRLEALGSDLLGALGGLLGPRQPLRVSGPVRMAHAGVLAWEVDDVAVASIPLPASAAPALVDRLTGGTDGAFHLEVPDAVGDVRVRSDGMTFYRRVG